jgi:hypothetical protein
MMNHSRSIFFTFFDKTFEKMNDIDIPTLGNKERNENVEKQNDEYMIKKAMMKGTDFDDIKKSEIKYLQAKYGNMVPDLTAVLNKNVLNSIHLRHKLSMLLHKNLKDPKLKLAAFVKCITIIEKDINEFLLPKGSLFKMVFYNRAEKLHIFIKSFYTEDNGQLQIEKYEIVSFKSSYMESLSRICMEQSQNYYGFDALFFAEPKHQAQGVTLKNHLDELAEKLAPDFREMDPTENMWSCLANRVESDMMEDEYYEPSESASSGAGEEKAAESELNSTVDEVMFLNFYQFCEYPKNEAIKSSMIKRFKDIIMFKQSDSAKLDKESKKTFIHMPDCEYAHLMEDLADIVTIYNRQFFSMVDKLIINASLTQPDN